MAVKSVLLTEMTTPKFSPLRAITPTFAMLRIEG
jgi:uncharacterized protein YggT (Ycf19 family)